MSEADAAKATDDSKGKDDSDVGLLKKIWDSIYNGPISKTLLILGIILLVFFALGGVPTRWEVAADPHILCALTAVFFNGRALRL